MAKLENDTRSIGLTPKYVEKSDIDIATIAALNEFAKKTGNILVLSGGYAVEAHCGGVIARGHGDIDAHFILTGSKTAKDLFSGIKKLLYRENTKWILREQRVDKVDYLEDLDTEDFFSKRRVEVRLNKPHEANVNYPIKKLIDSIGNEVEVCVVDLTQMVLEKIHKFYDLKDRVDTSKDRHSSGSDYFDLKRLLELKDLNIKEIKKKAPKAYEYVTSLFESYYN